VTDVSASVTWTSSNVSVAVMNGASAFGVAAGSSTIKAVLNGKSATASLTVTGLTVVKIDVLPSTLTLAPMASSALKAQATFSDGSTQDVSSSAAWASANGAVVSVSGQGVVFAVIGGQTDVKATFQGQTGTCHVTVPSVTLTGLLVSPASPTLFVGAQQQLTAMGTYSDGSMQDLTLQCSWSSQPPSVATVTAFGRVTAVSTGMAQVTAHFGALSASASVTVNPTTIASIEVSPAAPTLVKGSTLQLTATAVLSDGSTLDVTSSVMWSSNRPAVGAVTGSGLVTAISPGTATVTATMSGLSGSTVITVSMVPLSSIEVAPAALTLVSGQSQQYSATGVFGDGSTQDLTALCTWKSSVSTVAAVSGTGHAVAAAPGMTTVSCQYGGLTGAASLTVTAATVVSISLTPDSPSLAKGTTLSLHATGTFSDGSVQDVTQDCVWSSDKTSVASVSGSGLVTGVSVGTAQLTCTALGKSGSTPVTVGAPTLVSLEVSPAFATVAAGTSTALVATGVFSDDTTQDLTTQVTWTSSKPGVATVSNAAGSHGLARGVSAGTATITAAFGAVSGTATLNVTNATLTFIDVEPQSPFIEVNGKQQLTATAFYSDNSSQDITASSSWSSDTISVARVSNAPGSRGLTTGVAIGSAIITCTFQGQQGQAFISVNDGKLISIAVFPTAPNAAKGTKVQFQAVGVYDDGNAVDITTQVAWTSSDTTVATVSAAGLARAVGVGQAEITATLQGIGGSTVLTVGAATLSSIAITPLNPTVAQGGVQPLTATGTYSDGTTQDLTTQVIWSSSNTAVARISNAAGNQGFATGLTLGTSTVKARLGMVSGTTTLTVTNVTLQFLDVEPFGSLAPGTTLQLTVTGFYSDGSQADLTSQVSCSVDAPMIASVSPTNLVTAVMAGTVNITCTFGGQMGQTQLTVQNAAAIAVTPTNSGIKRGTTQQYTASAIFVDGSTQDVTAFATWSSNTPTVATVSNTAGSKGLVTGVAPGTASIKALLSGVGGSTTVTVTP
jgi:trimeric autotransporter adhesin